MLTLENPASRSRLVIILKRFVHSLGFAFLPLHVTIYIWDQLFMKVMKNRLEIFVCASVMLLCLKERILSCTEWDQIVDVIYQDASKIQYQKFIDQYREVYKDA